MPKPGNKSGNSKGNPNKNNKGTNIMDDLKSQLYNDARKNIPPANKPTVRKAPVKKAPVYVPNEPTKSEDDLLMDFIYNLVLKENPPVKKPTVQQNIHKPAYNKVVKKPTQPLKKPGNTYKAPLINDFVYVPSYVRIDYRPEFPSANIPYALAAVGTREDLEDYLQSNPNMSERDRQYINTRIQQEIFYENLRANKQKSPAPAPVMQNDGTLMLENIHLNQGQSSGNGCYSCSYQLLLQSRGVNLTQEQIRAYRPRGSFFEMDAQERMLGDNMGNIIDIGGISTNCMPNTAVVENVFNIGQDFEGQQQAYNRMKETILDALLNHHSPVSLLVGVHYRTIVGYNPDTDVLYIKNSGNHVTPDKNETQTLESLLLNSKVVFTHLMDIDPAHPTHNMDNVHGIEYLNGHYVQNDERSMNLPNQPLDVEGSNMITSSNLGGGTNVTTTIKVPTELVPTPEMIRDGYESPKIKSVEDSPEKQILKADVADRLNTIMPEGSILTVTFNNNVPNFSYTYNDRPNHTVTGTLTVQKAAEYFYLRSIEEKLEYLTPWQTAHALDHSRIQKNVEFYAGDSEDFRNQLYMLQDQPVNCRMLAPIVDHVADPNKVVTDTFKFTPCRLAGGIPLYQRHNAPKLENDNKSKKGETGKDVLPNSKTEKEKEIKDVQSNNEIGKSDKDILPTNEIVKSDKDILPTNEIVKSDKDVLPTNEIGKSDKDALPTNEIGKSDKGVLPTNEIGKSDKGVLPTNEIGKSDKDVLPINERTKTNEQIPPAKDNPDKELSKKNASANGEIKNMIFDEIIASNEKEPEPVTSNPQPSPNKTVPKIRENIKPEPDKYAEMQQSVSKLRNLVSGYYVYDDFGEQPRLMEEDIAELKALYSKTFEQASAYIDSVGKEQVDIERSKLEQADLIQEELQKDMQALEDAQPGKTLSDCMKYANSKVVNVTGKTFKKVGDRCSSRQMMTITGPDGKPLRGFFTERTYMGLNPQNEQYFADKLVRTDPEHAQIYQYAITEHFKNPGNMKLSSKLEADLRKRFGNVEGYDKAINALEGFAYNIGSGDYIAEDKLNEVKPVSPFDTRNIAYSNVTHLLGMDDKIARSTPLTIRNNGKDIHGCFMEFATGEDPSSPKPDGGFTTFNEHSIDNSPALKTLSDMQVLDYICGNVDRHGRNLFYKFDQNGKVVDFCGIDNDLSFGLLKPDFTKANAGGLKAIYHISRSMCEKIKALDEHLLMHAMDGLDLEQQNRDYAVERLKALKERINEGKVIVIEDKDYENYKMADFLADGNKEFTYNGKTIKPEKADSIYKSVDDFGQIVCHMSEYDRKQYFSDENSKEEINNSKEQLALDEAKNIKVEDLEMGVDAPQIQNLTNKLSRAGWFIFNSSPQFENVKTDLGRLSEATNLIGKDETRLTASTVKAMELGYMKLLKSATEYLNHKGEQGELNARSWTGAGRRIAAVREVARFCEGRINTLRLAVENTMDKEYLQKSDVREMQKEARNLMRQGLKPNEVGQYMKDLVDMHAKSPDDKVLTVKLGQQMSMCMDYIKENKGNPESYTLNADDLNKSKALLKESRLANQELKKDQDIKVRDEVSKAAILK